jgi:hypothetical protein
VWETCDHAHKEAGRARATHAIRSTAQAPSAVAGRGAYSRAMSSSAQLKRSFKIRQRICLRTIKARSFFAFRQSMTALSSTVDATFPTVPVA